MPGGYKDFEDLDLFTAAEVNDYLMSQVVARFASTGARNAAIPAPEQGQLCYILGVGFQAYDSVAGWSAAPLGAVQLVARQTLASAAASVSISGIPATYRQLRIAYSARSDLAASSWAAVRMRINNDSSSNYASQNIQHGTAGVGAQVSPGAQNSMFVGLVPAAGVASADYFGAGVIDIPSWYPPDGRSHVAVIGTGGFWYGDSPIGGYVSTHVGLADISGPYTSVQLFPHGGSWVAGTEFSVYGWA